MQGHGMVRGICYRVMQGLGAALPARWGEAAAVWLADRRHDAATGDRAAVRANLALVADAAAGASAEGTREVFRNFAHYLYEFFSAHQGHRLLVTLEHPERLRHAAGEGRGVIILSAHLGNWELGGIVLSRLGYSISVVALPHADSDMDRLFNAQRRRCGVEVIPLGPEAARTAMERLRQGALLAVLGDREFGEHGMFISFCGRRVIVPRGPALLSLRTGAPMLPTFFIREGARRFRFVFDEPIWPSPGAPHPAELERLIAASTAAIERAIRRDATQWLMMQSVAIS